jgi:hypothetical protein
MDVSEFYESEIELRDESQLQFDDNLVFGNFFKDLVVLLLGKCGYEVYPYGYESHFPNLKRRLLESQSFDVASRVRSTPDLLVANSTNNEVNLVEIKARRTSVGNGVKIRQIDLYQKFWPESVIVLVIPSGTCFYAQHVTKLDKSGMYDPTQFQPLEEIFPLISNLPSDFQQKMVRKAMTLFRDRQNGYL